MSAVVHEEIVDRLTSLVLESDALSCCILPEVGGKMIALVNKRTGREWIRPSKPVTYRRVGFEGNYGDFDRTGFDECFPAVASAEYPYQPWKGAVIPDHGEIWTIPWDWHETDNGLMLQVHGVRFPYVFSKEITAGEEHLLISYLVQNPSPCDFPCFWSAHPIFPIREGMQVLMPGHEKVVIDYSKDNRLGGYLDRLTWPKTKDSAGKEVDLSVFADRDAGTADKIYFCHVKEGYAALYDPDAGDYLGFTFDIDQVPHVGLWSNLGGWPFEGEPDYNVALEPSSGYPRELGVGEEQVIPTRGELRWDLRLHLGQAPSAEAVVDKLRSL